MFPMTKKQLERDETYEESKATLDCKIIPVHMFMDEHGSIFFLVFVILVIWYLTGRRNICHWGKVRFCFSKSIFESDYFGLLF